MSFPLPFFFSIKFENVLYHGGSNRLRRPITQKKKKKKKGKEKKERKKG